MGPMFLADAARASWYGCTHNGADLHTPHRHHQDAAAGVAMRTTQTMVTRSEFEFKNAVAHNILHQKKRPDAPTDNKFLCLRQYASPVNIGCEARLSHALWKS